MIDVVYWKVWLRRVLLGVVVVVLFIPFIFGSMLYEAGKLLDEALSERRR